MMRPTVRWWTVILTLWPPQESSNWKNILTTCQWSSRRRKLAQESGFWCRCAIIFVSNSLFILSLVDQDVIDLRKANWVTRRKDIGPTTIDQIHQEAKKEELKKKLASMTTDAPPPPRKSEDRRRWESNVWNNYLIFN